MISKTLLFRSRQHLLSMHLLTSPALRRFASQAAASSEYQAYDDNIFYTPVRPIDFKEGKALIFNNEDLPKADIKYTPWELKETTLKNFLGVFGFVALDYLFHPASYIYHAGVIGFGFNWINSMYSYMGHAIVKIELHEDGKTITATYKTGGSQTLKVKDIMKKRHEKELV